MTVGQVLQHCFIVTCSLSYRVWWVIQCLRITCRLPQNNILQGKVYVTMEKYTGEPSGGKHRYLWLCIKFSEVLDSSKNWSYWYCQFVGQAWNRSYYHSCSTQDWWNTHQPLRLDEGASSLYNYRQYPQTNLSSLFTDCIQGTCIFPGIGSNQTQTTKIGIQRCKKDSISYVYVQMSESTLGICQMVWEHIFSLIVE